MSANSVKPSLTSLNNQSNKLWVPPINGYRSNPYSQAKAMQFAPWKCRTYWFFMFFNVIFVLFAAVMAANFPGTRSGLNLGHAVTMLLVAHVYFGYVCHAKHWGWGLILWIVINSIIAAVMNGSSKSKDEDDQ